MFYDATYYVGPCGDSENILKLSSSLKDKFSSEIESGTLNLISTLFLKSQYGQWQLYLLILDLVLFLDACLKLFLKHTCLEQIRNVLLLLTSLTVCNLKEIIWKTPEEQNWNKTLAICLRHRAPKIYPRRLDSYCLNVTVQFRVNNQLHVYRSLHDGSGLLWTGFRGLCSSSASAA